MNIDTRLLAATASRFWRSKATPLARMARPALDVDEPIDASPPPAESEPLTMPPSKPSLPLPPGDVLHAALLALAGDDDACQMLLASASAQAREQLSTRLVYIEMTTPSARDPALVALVAVLNAATDDAARTAALSGASPDMCAQLGEHLRISSMPCDELAQRHMNSLVL